MPQKLKKVILLSCIAITSGVFAAQVRATDMSTIGFAVDYNLGTTHVKAAFTPYYVANSTHKAQECPNSQAIYNAIVVPIAYASTISNAMEQWDNYEYFNCHSSATKLIVDTINSATKTIYVAAYSFNNPDIAYALINKAHQGVMVKVIMDSTNTTSANSVIQVFSDNNILVYISSGYSIMHNKFMIIDGKLVQMGSLNYTMDATTQQANNITVIDSLTVATTYQVRWDAMLKNTGTTSYVSGTWNPSCPAYVPDGYTTPVASSRTDSNEVLYSQPFTLANLNPAIVQGLSYTYASSQNTISPYCTNYLISLGGTCLANYKDDNILKLIDNATKSIQISTMLLTDTNMVNALIAAHIRGVDIKIVADYRQNKSLGTSSKLSILVANGISVRLNNNYQILHDKYMVIDSKIVETGSYNYSISAYQYNAENYIIVYNQPAFAASYQKDFELLYAEGFDN